VKGEKITRGLNPLTPAIQTLDDTDDDDKIGSIMVSYSCLIVTIWLYLSSLWRYNDVNLSRSRPLRPLPGLR